MVHAIGVVVQTRAPRVRTFWQALAAPKPRQTPHVHQLLHDARVRDPLGHQVQTVIAMLFLFTMPLSTAAAGIAFALLAFNTLLRLPHTFRCYEPPVDARSLWWMAAFVAWCAISLKWSTNRHLGFEEIGASRVLLLPLLLWTVLDRVPWLIAAALLGVFAQNLMQVLQATDWIQWRPHEGEGRLGGLVHPIHTGMWCTAAMIWHIMATLRSRGIVRVVSILGFLIAGAGLIASGSRGPWLAAIIVMPLALLVTLIRRPDVRRPAIILATAGFITAAAATPLVYPQIAQRIEQSVSEFNDARERGVYWTSIGSRVAMTKWACEIFASHPIQGVGAGGYPAAQDKLIDFQNAVERLPAKRHRTMMIHQQPHSTWLYVLACTGLIGAALFACGVIVALRQCWRDPPDHLYADAAFFIMIAWIIGASFDSYNLNGELWGLFALLIAITMPMRPPIRLVLSAPNETPRTLLASSHHSADPDQS